MIAAPTAASEVYSALMTLREHDEGMPVSVETLKRIQLDLAAVSLHVMESGVNLLTQQDPQQTRDHLHQLAEQARDVGLANSAHAELPGAAASSYGTYEAEVRLANLRAVVIRLYSTQQYGFLCSNLNVPGTAYAWSLRPLAASLPSAKLQVMMYQLGFTHVCMRCTTSCKFFGCISMSVQAQ